MTETGANALCSSACRPGIDDGRPGAREGEMVARTLKVAWMLAVAWAANVPAAEVAGTLRQARVANGVLEGGSEAGGAVHVFKGVPYAAAPVGDLRWRPPQAPANWAGVRKATEFGARCTQGHPDLFPFLDKGESEDCLFVNVWTPAKSPAQKLPVLVWIHGGAFTDGASSEARYDGTNLARKGIVVVSLNYRLGIFGFFSHPELTKEQPDHASGNQGLLDQLAALRWVSANIAAFGGDPGNVTIAGESAGAHSVSALMASASAQPYFQKAIGESGALFHTLDNEYTPHPLADAERLGSKFAKSINAPSIADLRGLPADTLAHAAASSFKTAVCIDGSFLTTSVAKAFATNAQARVPLLAGWNSDEGSMLVLGAKKQLTAGGFKMLASVRYGFDTLSLLKIFPADNDAQAYVSATQLAGDDFVAYGTWKWLNLQSQSGQPAVYRYYFEQVPANKPGATMGPLPLSEMGSYHSAELEYVFQTIKRDGVPLTTKDIKLADQMSSYWTNFIKTGDPNGNGLPSWPAYQSAGGYPVMHLVGDTSHAAPEDDRARYTFMDAHAVKPK
jgi:para-nitrobenzyl esterase